MSRTPLSRRPSAYLSGLPGYFGALARLPGVGALAPVVGLYLEPLGDGGQTARVLRPWRRLMGGSGYPRICFPRYRTG